MMTISYLFAVAIERVDLLHINLYLNSKIPLRLLLILVYKLSKDQKLCASLMFDYINHIPWGNCKEC